MPEARGEVAEVVRHEELRSGRDGDFEKGLVALVRETPQKRMRQDFFAITFDLLEKAGDIERVEISTPAPSLSFWRKSPAP